MNNATPGQWFVAEQLQNLIMGLANMQNRREVELPSQLQLFCQPELLPVNVGIFNGKVESDFSHGNYLAVIPQVVFQRFQVLFIVMFNKPGMNAQCTVQAYIAGGLTGEFQQFIPAGSFCAGYADGFDTLLPGTLNDVLAICIKLREVEMAMAVYQGNWMVHGFCGVRDCAYNACMNYKQCMGMLLVAMVLLAILVVPRQLQQLLHSPVDKTREYHQLNCRVSEGCQLRQSVSGVTLVIKPYTMPLLQPLQVDVVVTGIEPESVSLEFVGRDMPMGLAPHSLSLHRSANDEWHYQGVAMVTFCPVDRNMVWLVELIIESDRLIKTIVFELENQ